MFNSTCLSLVAGKIWDTYPVGYPTWDDTGPGLGRVFQVSLIPYLLKDMGSGFQ